MIEQAKAQFAHIIVIKRSTMELFKSSVFPHQLYLLDHFIQSSILKRSGNPGRDNLKAIAEGSGYSKRICGGSQQRNVGHLCH